MCMEQKASASFVSHSYRQRCVVKTYVVFGGCQFSEIDCSLKSLGLRLLVVGKITSALYRLTPVLSQIRFFRDFLSFMN